MGDPLKILFLAAEADPFVKVGGLGDVAGSLPTALSALGDIDIRLVIPFHGAIQRLSIPLKRITTFEIPYLDGTAHVEALAGDLNGVPVYFISGDLIPRDAPVYTTDPGVDGYKFTFFSLAALELARQIGWSPDIAHANDWHTAPALYALWKTRRQDPIFQHTATVMGLHNLPYLGVGAGAALRAFGLPPAEGSDLPAWAQDIPLPLGLLAADHIVAASPNYAREILTPEFGAGLDGFLKAHSGKISGILNGLNLDKWDPSIDSVIPSRFDEETLGRRTENKIALLSEIDLDPDPTIPLLGMVTRMDPQKGIDLMPPAMRLIADKPWQLIVLGAGLNEEEVRIRGFEKEYPDRVRAAIRYDAQLSRLIYAGADLLLIPSRYEPCGLTQMIAMRYGCVPLARATGGLSDTIQNYRSGKGGTGFLFKKAAPEAFARSLRSALSIFSQPEEWRSMQRLGMAQDFSWDRFARQYEKLYRALALRMRTKNSLMINTSLTS